MRPFKRGRLDLAEATDNIDATNDDQKQCKGQKSRVLEAEEDPEPCRREIQATSSDAGEEAVKR